jgi:hypothetical protein
MSTASWVTVARYGGTAVMAGLTAAYGYYPSVHWLPIAIAVVGTIGFHVVPSAVQSAAEKTPMQTEEKT